MSRKKVQGGSGHERERILPSQYELPDIFSLTFNESGLPNQIPLDKVVQAEWDHDHPKRNGWGTWRNMGRAKFVEHAMNVVHGRSKPQISEVLSPDALNAKLAEAEEEERKNKP